MPRLLNNVTNLAVYAKAGTQIASGEQLERALILAKTAQISTSLDRIEDLNAAALSAQSEMNDLAAQQTMIIESGLNALSGAFSSGMTLLSQQLSSRLDEQLAIQIKNHQQTISSLETLNDGIQGLTRIAKKQLSEQRRSNLLARNPEQTRADEFSNRGKRRIQALSLIGDPASQKLEINAAIHDFTEAIKLDPFNEQSLLQLAIWTRHLDDGNEAWLQYFKDAMIRAQVELNNADKEQQEIANDTVRTLAFCIPVCFTDSGRFQEYLVHFKDFCESQSRRLPLDEQRTVYALGIVAALYNKTSTAELRAQLSAVVSRFGVMSMLDELLLIKPIVENPVFVSHYSEIIADLKTELRRTIAKIDATGTATNTSH